MNKRIISTIMVIVMLFSFITFTQPKYAEAASTPSTNLPQNLTLYRCKKESTSGFSLTSSQFFEIAFKNATSAPIFTFSKDGIVTHDLYRNNRITAKAVGKTKLTVKIGKTSFTCNITVKEMKYTNNCTMKIGDINKYGIAKLTVTNNCILPIGFVGNQSICGYSSNGDYIGYISHTNFYGVQWGQHGTRTDNSKAISVIPGKTTCTYYVSRDDINLLNDEYTAKDIAYYTLGQSQGQKDTYSVEPIASYSKEYTNKNFQVSDQLVSDQDEKYVEVTVNNKTKQQLNMPLLQVVFFVGKQPCKVYSLKTPFEFTQTETVYDRETWESHEVIHKFYEFSSLWESGKSVAHLYLGDNMVVPKKYDSYKVIMPEKAYHFNSDDYTCY